MRFGHWRTLVLSVLVVGCGRVGFDDGLPVGASCLDNDECTGSCIDGTCTVVSGLGGPCDDNDDGDCEMTAVCVARRCVSSTSPTCAVNSDCGADTCIGSRCSVLSPTGGACDDTGDCAEPTDSCTAGQCAPSATAGGATMAGGVFHACALEADMLRCWGDNSAGQLGDGTVIERHVPVVVTGMSSGVTSVAAGEYHTCAIQGGGVKCWGAQYGSGRLGDNGATATYTSTPVQVVGLTSGVMAIAAGYYHTCALMTDRTVRCWGFPTSALGAGTNVSNTSIPNVVLDPTGTMPLTNVSKIVASPDGYHTCALVGTTAYCWGDNQAGALGDNTLTERFLPIPFTGASSVDIAGNLNFTCSVETGGGMQCSGTNAWGQLGDSTTVDRKIPVSVTGLPGVVTSVVAGTSHTCAAIAGGVVCWGASSVFQLGTNPSSSTCLGFPCQKTPIDVAGLGAGSGVVELAASGGHTCARLAGGSVRCWGQNGHGELGNNTTMTTGAVVSPVGF